MLIRCLTTIVFGCVAFVGAENSALADATTGSIAGTVTSSSSGLPLSDVNIRVDEDRFQFGTYVAATTSTNAQGQYLVEGLYPNPGWPYHVRADAGEFWVVQYWNGVNCPPVPIYCRSVGGEVSVTAGQTTQGVDIALHPAGILQGQITRTDTAAPVASATIAPFFAFDSDSAGMYRLTSAAPGSYILRASAAGLITTFSDGQQCDAFLDCSTVAAEPVIVTENATTTADIALAPAVTIDGHIRVADNSIPGQNYSVRAYNESDPQRTFVAVALGANIDTYQFSGLMPRAYSVRFGDPADTRYFSQYFPNITCAQDPCDLTGATHFNTVTGQSVSDVNAILQTRQHVSGRILDATNQAPIVDARVQALIFVSQIFFSYWNPVSTSYTDVGGNFDLPGVPANVPFAIGAVAHHYIAVQTPNLPGGTPPFQVDLDQNLVVGDVELSRGAIISGHVVNSLNGKAIAQADVAFYVDDNNVSDSLTDDDGAYESPAFGPGSFKALVYSSTQGQMYDHIACADSCDLALATPISLNNSDITGIDFALEEPDAVFSAGFGN